MAGQLEHLRIGGAICAGSFEAHEKQFPSVSEGVWRVTVTPFDLAMILFTGGICQAGWPVITRTITMSDADHYTGTAFSELFDIGGQSYRINCANSVGERFA